MVENHPDARPQSGLSEADIVYETLAEGGITRFLVLFQSRAANEIGSVRSARDYFAEIANEWGALYAHVGGSNEVIANLKKGIYENLDDANEYYNGDFFPRKKEKSAPHEIFTSTQNLRNLIAEHNFSDIANYLSWQFKDDSPTTASGTPDIYIDFSRAGYEVTWEYDPAQNNYKRNIYFEADYDAVSKEQIRAKNVVIQMVDVTPVPKDPFLRVDIDLNGGSDASAGVKNKAIIFQDGKSTVGFWKRENNRTRFFDANSQEIKFNRGPIWLELVPEDKEVNLKW